MFDVLRVLWGQVGLVDVRVCVCVLVDVFVLVSMMLFCVSNAVCFSSLSLSLCVS